MTDLETFKQQAAIQAVTHVRSGMAVGLGTGSTAKYAILEIGRLLRENKLSGIVGVPTSEASAQLAIENGIPLAELTAAGVEVAIDGADEIDPNLDLIKGHGNALVKEKLVEFNAKLFIVVADSSKLVSQLGEKFSVPVEIMQWGYKATLIQLAAVAPQVQVRQHFKDGQAVISDNGNYIAHCTFTEIKNPRETEDRIRHIPGVIGTGLFLGLAKIAYVAGENGVQKIKR
jgi:ribose 5-phosphate isomerase A